MKLSAANFQKVIEMLVTKKYFWLPQSFDVVVVLMLCDVMNNVF